MTAGWLFPSAADRRLLGAARFRGPTPWLIAIMSFSIMIVAATGLALASAAATLSHAVGSRYAVEVPNAPLNLDRVVGVLRTEQGVSSIEVVPEGEMRRTLERWLGPAANSPDLPVPGLVNFDARARTDLQPIEERLQAIAPAVRVSAHGERLAPLLHSLRALQWLAFGLVLMLSVAAAAAVVLAAKGALDTHRFTIEVMHGIGATDLQLTHLFQRKIAIDALAGSLGGAAAGAVVLALLASGATFAGDLLGGETLPVGDILVLILLPFILTALATWVARLAVLAALRETL